MPKLKHVLLIDDDPISLLVCETIIKKYDFAHEVTTFKNGQEALTYIKTRLSNDSENFPKIIFLDINMPMLSGWDFLEEAQPILQNFEQKPKVVMLSSTFDPEDFEKAKTYNLVLDFISKPLTVENLKELAEKNL